MATTVPTTLNLQNIAEVAIVTSADEVNRYLALGWLLLGLSSNQYSENGFTLNYHLGWCSSLGETKRAESDMSVWLNKQAEPVEPAQASEPEQG